MANTSTTPVVNPNGNAKGEVMPPANGKSRIHIKKILSNGVEINVFGDDPESTFALIVTAIGLCEGEPLPTSPAAERAHQDRVYHEASVKNLVNSMACQVCGSHNLKLISWTDKKTGMPVKKWRCQEVECQAWQKDN